MCFFYYYAACFNGNLLLFLRGREGGSISGPCAPAALFGLRCGARSSRRRRRRSTLRSSSTVQPPSSSARFSLLAPLAPTDPPSSPPPHTSPSPCLHVRDVVRRCNI